MERAKKLWQMFRIFFKIGAFTFGGGMAMLPVIHKEFVDKHRWISEEEMLDVFAVSQSMPGVIALNASIFIGYRLQGVPGAIVATLAQVLPSFCSILLVLLALSFLQGNPYVDRVMAGIRAASAALILRSTVNLIKKTLKKPLDIAIAAAAFILIVFVNLNVVYAIALGAVAGLSAYGIRRAQRHV